jgi:hypothetical protein
MLTDTVPVDLVNPAFAILPVRLKLSSIEACLLASGIMY